VAVAGLIGRDCDGRRHTTPSKVFAVGSRGVGLVGQDPVGASSRPPTVESRLGFEQADDGFGQGVVIGITHRSDRSRETVHSKRVSEFH